MIHIFGEPWDAPICDDAIIGKTPVGTDCVHCTLPIEDGQSGVLQNLVVAERQERAIAYHRECYVRQVICLPMARYLRLGEGDPCSGSHPEHERPTTPQELWEEACAVWEAMMGPVRND